MTATQVRGFSSPRSAAWAHATPLAPARPAGHTRGMWQYPPDYRLWGLVSGCLFVPALAAWLAWGPFGGPRESVEEVAVLGLACAAVGWSLQSVAVVCGVRHRVAVADADETALLLHEAGECSVTDLDRLEPELRLELDCFVLALA